MCATCFQAIDPQVCCFRVLMPIPRDFVQLKVLKMYNNGVRLLNIS